MAELPSGTVTFLFTDIEGSTKLLQQLGAERYGDVLAAQRTILRTAFESHDGKEIDTQGDAFFVSSTRASDAVAAVIEIQRALAAHAWPEGVEVRVRMGLHTGEPLVAEDGYVGMDVHRAARIAHVGHGGQVLVSEATAGLLKRDLPEGVSLRDLGEYQLKDLRTTWKIYQLVIEGLPSDFPPLKARLVKPPAEPDIHEPKPQPAFMNADAPSEMGILPTFVTRERELEWLKGFLAKALAGQGQVAFLSGGAGQGKTALIEFFARRSMEEHSDLLVISGHCDAFTGSGDPYRPFRGALGMLIGNVETRWEAGAVTTDQARRLWGAVPVAGKAVTEQGEDLIGTLLNGKELLERAGTTGLNGQDWVLQLRARLQAERLEADLGQVGLFGQVANVLRSVALEHPLVITLDDLQWADRGSLDLLFHLGRELAGARVLILGAYRDDEVALGREGERHPLEKVLAEFKRRQGDVVLDLGQAAAAEGRAFVDAYLDNEPNRLSAGFRKALFAHTQGHPLFIVELLRALQERGELLQDEEGYWIEEAELDWNLLPSKIEGVIEERISRLEETLREMLMVASVEGEDFTAQVVARVRQANEQGVIRQLSQELDRKHHLVGETGNWQVGKQRMHLYHFRHSLFQQHLYNGLTENEKEILHGEVGTVLEGLYGKEAGKIAAQLAWHFTMAGEGERALPYLLQAGDQARQLQASREAVSFYEKALGIQKEMGRLEEATGTLMRLGLSYQAGFDHRRARQAYEESFALRKRVLAAPSANLPPAPHPYREFTPEPVSLDPAIINDIFSAYILHQIFSGLLRFGPDWTIQPEVAREWEISDDGLRYVFHLREDVFWSDGEPVTAQDFEYAWKRYLDPSIKRTSEIIYPVRGGRGFHEGETDDPDTVAVRALDPYTIEVELEEPTAYFLNLVTVSVFLPIPRHVVERYGPDWTQLDHLVTNGSFRLKERVPGEKLILERNPTYFGRFRGNLTRIEFYLNQKPTPQERLAAYQADQVDVLLLEPDTFHARHQHPEEYVQGAATPQFLGFGQTESPFHDRRVRQAFALAIDREHLANEVFDGMQLPATGGFLPPGFPGHSPEIALPFDPDRARALLAEAGYPDGKDFPQVDLMASSSSQMHIKITQAIILSWRQHLGVQVDPRFEEWGYVMKHARKMPMFVMGWSPDYPDPDTFLRVAVRSNASFWKHPVYDQLIEKATRTTDTAERLRLYRQADRILMEEAAIVPLLNSVRHYLIKLWVKLNERFHPVYLNLKDVTIEPH